jgi:NifU-like protein
MNDFNKKPFLVSSESQIQIDSKNYHVYLDINNRSRIEGLYFICDKSDIWFNVFSSLSKVIEGVQLAGVEQAILSWKEDTKSLIKNKVFLLPELLFHLALDEYHGKSFDHETLSGIKSEQLICRCFGVYEKHIEDYVIEHSTATVLDIVDDLKASVGCGSCHSKVVETLDRCRSKKIISNLEGSDLSVEFDNDGNRIRPLGLTPSDFILKVDQLKETWIKDQELSRYKIEIESVQGLDFKFKIIPNESAQYILETLKDHIESKLHLHLSFNLLT